MNHPSGPRTAVDVDFFLYQFKTELCTSTRQHEWKSCPCFHVGSCGVEKARRRDPRKHNYESTSCSEFQQTGACPNGDACPLAHGVFETWLHPTKFCTVMCTDGPACRRKVCWFAHSPSELRAPTPAPAAAAAARMQPAQAAGAAGLPAAGLQRQLPAGPFYASNARAAGYEACARPSVLCDWAPASSCSAGSSPLSSPTSASSTQGAGDTASTAGSCSSSSTVRSSTCLRSHTSCSPRVAMPGSESTLPPPLRHPCTAYVNQHSQVAASSTSMLPLQQHYGVSGPYGSPIAMSAAVQPPGAYSRHMPPALSGTAALPSDSLLQHLQQLQLQHDTVSVLQSPLQGSSVWRSMGSSSAAAVPASIMPMLPHTSCSGALLDCGSLAPLSGLLGSLEEQAVRAQLQADNARAAAAAATNNLAAMLAALGVLPGMQAAGRPPAALLQQQQALPF